MIDSSSVIFESRGRDARDDFSRERNEQWRGEEEGVDGSGGEGIRARFTLQNDGGTRSKLGGAPDTTLPSENLANKRRKQERGETLWGGLRKSKSR